MLGGPIALGAWAATNLSPKWGVFLPGRRGALHGDVWGAKSAFSRTGGVPHPQLRLSMPKIRKPGEYLDSLGFQSAGSQRHSVASKASDEVFADFETATVTLRAGVEEDGVGFLNSHVVPCCPGAGTECLESSSASEHPLPWINALGSLQGRLVCTVQGLGGKLRSGNRILDADGAGLQGGVLSSRCPWRAICSNLLLWPRSPE